MHPIDTGIRIHPDNDQIPNTPSEARINGVTSSTQHTVDIDVNTNSSSNSSPVQQSFLSFLCGARNHLGGRPINVQTAVNDHAHNRLQPEDSNINTWRVNLSNALSFSAAPLTETIRSWIPRSGTFRYVPSSRASPSTTVRDNQAISTDENAPANDVVINLSTTTVAERSENNSSASREPRTSNSSRTSLSRMNSVGLTVGRPPARSAGETNLEPGTRAIQPNSVSSAHRTPSTLSLNDTTEIDEDNLVNDMAVKILSHFVRYLPFIAIVFMKSMYDHWLGIVDIVVLHCVVYQVNKSLCQQVAKMSQKNLGLLFRDYLLVTFVVVYRFMLADSQPDYLGLLINTAHDPHSFGQLLHAVAINDLILKLITITIKILVTVLPVNVIKHKPRGRLFALIEAISQMYRALVPVRNWLVYLLVYVTGLDIVVGMFFFSSLYLAAKAYEFFARGYCVRQTLNNFLKNVEYGRQPTKEELNEAGTLCPICHDSFDTPVALECNHIFCEVCVGTWFKREQTCPMCRANVADDPSWQDGSTTLFYQLC